AKGLAASTSANPRRSAGPSDTASAKAMPRLVVVGFGSSWITTGTSNLNFAKRSPIPLSNAQSASTYGVYHRLNQTRPPASDVPLEAHLPPAWPNQNIPAGAAATNRLEESW